MSSAAGPLRAVILTDRPPRWVAQLITKIHDETAGIRICGILYRIPPLENPSPSSLLPRFFASAGHALLRLVHACPPEPNGRLEFTTVDLAGVCARTSCALQVVSTWDPAEVGALVARTEPQLGIVYAKDPPGPDTLRSLSFDLLTVRQGAVTGEKPGIAHKIQVRVGLLRRGAQDVQPLCAASFVAEPLDTPRSLTLKADLMAKDLLMRVVANSSFRDAARVPDRPEDSAAVQSNLDDLGFDRHARRLPSTARSRPAWKLLLRTLLFGPFVVLRNWRRRWRGSFPVVILYHHLVADRPHRMGISTEHFLRQVRFLKRHYRVASLAEAVGMLKAGKVTTPTVVLTLDDGYQDNFLNLRAVAEEVGGLPATLFLCSQNLISQDPFQHDANRGEHGFPPLTWEQVATLQREGFEMGSHTRTHFDCGSTDGQKLAWEILGSKSDLEEHLNEPMLLFSFPWGNPENMSKPAIETARAAYRHLFSACGGENFPSAGGEFWHLKRRCHPNDLWELELTLQSALELEPLGRTSKLRDIFA